MPLRRQVPAITALILVSVCGYLVSSVAGPLSPADTTLLVFTASLIIWQASAWCRRLNEERITRYAHSAERLATLGEAAAGIAHEINNPLAYMDSNLNGLAEDIEAYNEFITTLDNASDHLEIRNPFYQKALEAYQQLDIANVCDNAPVRVKDCLEGIQHLERIVSDMQVLSRHGASDLHLADINADLTAVFNIIRSRLPAGVSLTVELMTLPPMLCHPARFAQVVMNMLVNGLHAIESGTGQLMVRQRMEGNMMYTEIEDNGCGMSADIQARIFEPFFTTRAEGKGTGIGLALCYKLIEEHQGSIDVHSQPGEGTRFTLMIPVRYGDEDNAD